MINFDFIDKFNDVIAMRSLMIDLSHWFINDWNHLYWNIDVIRFLENVFVQIRHEFDRNVYLNVDMSFVFQQQIWIIKNHSIVVSRDVRHEFSLKASILRVIWRVIQIWFRTYRLREMFDAIIILVMTYDIFNFVTICQDLNSWIQVEFNLNSIKTSWIQLKQLFATTRHFLCVWKY